MIGIALPKEVVAKSLNLITPHVERFVAKYPADYTVGRIIGGLLDGQLHGFMAWDDEAGECLAFAYGELIEGFDGSRTLHMRMIEGADLERWREPLQAEMDRYAKAIGCKAILFIGRKGWKSRLPGWRIKYHVYERPVA